MGKIRNSRVPITVLYILLFIAGGLSRNLFGDPASSRAAFIYIVTLAIWFHDIRKRVLDDTITRIVSAICGFSFYLMITRTIKYSLVAEVNHFGKLAWYLPSIGVVQIATLLFLLAAEIGEGDRKGFRKIYLIAVPGIIINLLMITNDFHKLAYRFISDEEYEYGWLYYVYLAWVIALFVASLVIMYRKCSVNPGRKYVWIPFSVLLGSFIALNLITNVLDRITYTTLFKYNWFEAFVMMVVVYIESSIAIGLIPSRYGFDTLFRKSSVAVEIEDSEGNVVLNSAAELGDSDNENTIRKHAAIPGGYICWNDDISDINKITDIILNREKQLSEELDLIYAEKSLYNKEEEYNLKVAIYDDITHAVAPQAKHIEKLLSQSEPNFSELVIYGVFIKRKANLMIISADSDTISIGELFLSLKDALEYLKLRGISIELSVKGTEEDLKETAPSSMVISLFDGYERYVEENLARLDSLKVSIAPGSKPQLHIDAVCGKEKESYVLS